MRSDVCDNGDRRPAYRARIAEKNGTTAVVLAVPVEECPSCAQVWLTMETAIQLDTTFNRLLQSGAELSQTHWEGAARLAGWSWAAIAEQLGVTVQAVHKRFAPQVA